MSENQTVTLETLAAQLALLLTEIRELREEVRATAAMLERIADKQEASLSRKLTFDTSTPPRRH